MYNLSKKQKIMIGVLLIAIIGFIGYYVYARENNNTELESDLEMLQEETKKEESSNNKILVHISGAIHHEGIIELEAESRISDAIEKARRDERRR